MKWRALRGESYFETPLWPNKSKINQVNSAPREALMQGSGYWSPWGALMQLPYAYEFLKKGNKFVTKECRKLANKKGIEIFRFYIKRYYRKYSELIGVFFPEEIIKEAREMERDTTDRREKDRVRKTRQRERERLARLKAQKPLIEEILSVLNAILSIRTKLEQISTHELICKEAIAVYDRGEEIFAFEEGVYEIATEDAKNWLWRFGSFFRDGTLIMNTKNPLLQQEIDEVVNFFKK